MKIIYIILLSVIWYGSTVHAQDTSCGIIWYPIVQLSDSMNSDFTPRITLSGDDTIHVTWHPDYFIRLPYARSTNGGQSFEPTLEMLTDTVQFPYGANRPFVLANSSQVFLLFTNGLWPLYMIESTDRGTTFLPVEQTNNENSLFIDWATIEGDSLLMLYPRDGRRVIHRSTNSGSTWSTLDANLGEFDRISLAGGKLHHVYHANYGIAEIEYRQSTDLGESWQPPKPISELDGAWGEIPDITGYPSECGTEIIASWRDTKYGTSGCCGASIITRSSPDGGDTWLPELLLTPDPKGIESSVSINGRTRAVAWAYDLGSFTIRTMVRATNNSLFNYCPMYDVTNGASNAGRSMIAVSSNAVHVVWSQQFGNNFRILYRRGEFIPKDVTFALSTGSMGFDTTEVSETLIDTIFVTNGGTDPLIIGTAISSTTSFSAPSIPDTIPGMSTVPVLVHFHPKAGGSQSGKITLYHDGETSPDCFTVTGHGTWNSESIPYVSGAWQLVSIPLNSGYPQQLPLLYSFDGSYRKEDSLVFGRGYWAKPGDSVVTYEGVRTDSVAIPVRKGWNLIGALHLPVAISDVIAEPDGILGAFYEFTGDSYSVADVIRPGRAYWVKATTEGMMTLLGGIK